MKYFLFAAIVFATFAGSFAAALQAERDSLASVPLRQEHGALLVAATVDGAGPLLFTLDLGAGDLYTSYARARLDGRAPTRVCLSTLCFRADTQYYDGSPNDMDPQHDSATGAIAGSIGPHLLARYVVRIDYGASTLTLVYLSAFVPPGGARRDPYFSQPSWSART